MSSGESICVDSFFILIINTNITQDLGGADEICTSISLTISIYYLLILSLHWIWLLV